MERKGNNEYGQDIPLVNMNLKRAGISLIQFLSSHKPAASLPCHSALLNA